MKRRIKKERPFSSIVNSPFTYIILLGFLVLFSYSAINTYKKSKIAKESTAQVERELVRLLNQEEGLKNAINDMNTSFGVEKALREKFGIIKEGEKSIILLDPKEEPVQIEEKGDKGFFNFIRRIF